MLDEEVALITVLLNFLSAIWSYFCISASLDRRSRAYDFMHDSELAWYALWASCQVLYPHFPLSPTANGLTKKKTFALLVSFTNLSLLLYIAARAYTSFVNTVKAQVDLWRKVLWVLAGVGCVLAGAPIAFLPWKLTCVETGRLDENIFIHCGFFLLPFFLTLD